MFIENHSPSISVCMPVYNAACYINECIDSILSQTFTDFELLIIDDGSTDNSCKLIEAYQDTRIRLIKNKHDYISTINLLLKEAKGKYIARMDSDDIMFPDRLQHQYEYMESHPEVDIAGGGTLFFGNLDLDFIPQKEEITIEMMLEGCCLCNPSTILRRSSIIQAHLSYNREYIYAEDYHFWIEAIKAGLRLKNIKKRLVKYRMSDGQICSVHKKVQETICARIHQETRQWILERENGVVTEIIKLPVSGNQLTIVIPFLNEKEEVALTVRSIRKTAGEQVDIIVINDASDGSYDYLHDLEGLNVHYINNKVRIGAALSKEKGARLATTPYFLLLDAHMRFYSNDWHQHIEKALSINEEQLLCCQTKVLKKIDGIISENESVPTHGAYLSFEQDSYIPTIHWNTHPKNPLLTDNAIPAVLGASYATSKRYWNKIKGLQGLMHYGSEEAYISIKAWLEGGGCHLLPEVTIGHIYRNKFPYSVIHSQTVYNYLFIAATLFPTSLRCMAHAVAWKKDRMAYLEASKWLHSKVEIISILRNYYQTLNKNDFFFIQKINALYEPSTEIEIKKGYEQLSQLMSFCIQQAENTTSYGINGGLMGYVILFCHYFSYSGISDFEDKATILFENVLDNLEEELPVTFGHGLCGIGWGIIYLQKHEFLKENMEKELSIIDRLIMERSPLRCEDYTLKSGLGGVLAYVLTRLQQTKKCSNPFSDNYLQELKEASLLMLEEKEIDHHCRSLAMQIELWGKQELVTLLPEFEDLISLPNFLPQDIKHWTPNLNGIVGYTIDLLKKLSNFKNK